MVIARDLGMWGGMGRRWSKGTHSRYTMNNFGKCNVQGGDYPVMYVQLPKKVDLQCNHHKKERVILCHEKVLANTMVVITLQ